MTNAMTFQEALTILGIESRAQRIFSSHPSGELFFLDDYIHIAKFFEKINNPDITKTFFTDWFFGFEKFIIENHDKPQKLYINVLESFNNRMKRLEFINHDN